MVLAYLVPLASLAVPVALVYLAVRFLRAYERRGQAVRTDEQIGARLALLEAQCAELAAENARLKDEQRFTQDLLARSATARGASTMADASGPAA